MLLHTKFLKVGTQFAISNIRIPAQISLDSSTVNPDTPLTLIESISEAFWGFGLSSYHQC